MWQLFRQVYDTLVFEPELNILYFFYRLTGDIGISIILLAVLVNLIIYPMFAKNYLSLQKSKILQPKIKEIQEKYRKDPQKTVQKMREFNKKHGISTGYTFFVLVVQVLIISGLFYVIRDVVADGQLSRLYSWAFGRETVDLRNSDGKVLAFGLIDIGASATTYLWIPLITLLSSYLLGMYTFRWSKNPELPKVLQPKKTKNKSNKPTAYDPEVMQKVAEFQSIYVFPLFMLAIQYGLPTGLNIYFAVSSVLALIRQVVLNTYYTSHTEKFIKDLIDSDPSSKDNNPDNNLEVTADPSQVAATQPVATLNLKKKKSKIAVKKKKNK